MRLDRAGLPFIGGALLPGLALALAGRPRLAAPFVALGGFMAYFFRDPDREIPSDARAVLSPADGRVVAAGPADPLVAPPGVWQQVSVFLSPLDVHVNRSPASGRVTRIEYRPGRFLPAYDDAASTENEQTEIWIVGGGYTVVCRQIVGVLARRIVCRITPGTTVRAGDRIGLMKFGSRMDVFVPEDFTLRISTGARVRAGETIIATPPDV